MCYKAEIHRQFVYAPAEIQNPQTYPKYDFLGDTANNANSVRTQFAASLSDEDGNGSKETLIIQATNPSLQANENASVIFKVRSIS